MANVALIIAGGSGARMHQDIPKQFLTVNERPVIVYTLEAFQRHAEIDAIAVVCIEGWDQVLWAYARQFNISKLKYVIPGGSNGQGSIRNGVFELEKHFAPEDIVLVHDAIRPMVSAETARQSEENTDAAGISDRQDLRPSQAGARSRHHQFRGFLHAYDRDGRTGPFFCRK